MTLVEFPEQTVIIAKDQPEYMPLPAHRFRDDPEGPEGKIACCWKNWVRVTKKEPCRICGKCDWCTWSEFGACCMRVQSDHTLKNGGWLHRDEQRRRAPVREWKPEPTINTTKLIAGWRQTTTGGAIDCLGKTLNVAPSALLDLEVAYAPEHRAWAFPMRDGYGEYVGVRLRSESGFKWCVKGSHTGIFLPRQTPQKRVLIPEGPTDTAAALTLGYFAMGRPHNTGGVSHIVTACRRLCIREAIVIADNDEPGLIGAQSLCGHLPCASTIVVLPCKDLREFVKLGGNGDLLDNIINQAVWQTK